MIALLTGQWRGIAAAAAVAALLGGIWWMRHDAYRDGVKAATDQFLAADRKGAEDARATAARVLRDLADVDDVDELLTRTDGLRD